MARAIDDLEVALPPLVPVGSRSHGSVRSGSIEAVAARVLDVVVASVTLVVLAPLMALIALAVVCTSRGPVLFRQTRVAQGGQLFRMWKFRSMATDTTARLATDETLRKVYEENGFKLPEGVATITRVGRLLRRTSLDELPQLFHVLAGTMSLVGVRPIEPDELATRPARDREVYIERRPGMTGLWQVAGRSALTYEQRCDLDHEYVATWSLRNDLVILARTPLAMLRIFETV